jgi:hypothetical protein
MSLHHVKTSPVADFTGTVTVFDSQGQTVTANASVLVRPSDWNSVHYAVYRLGGNTAGASTVSGTDVRFDGGNNITVSADTLNSRLIFNGPNTSPQTAYVFADGNGVSFGTNGSTVTATVATDYVPLTNSTLFQATSATSAITSLAFPSADTTKFAGTGTTFAGTNVSATIGLDSNGLNLALSAPSGGGGAGDGGNVLAAGTQTANSTGTVFFSDANGIAFGMNNSSVITASYTVPTQTVQTQASGDIARTGYTSTTQAGSTVGATLNTVGLSMAWPQFITTYAAQTVQTQASGNIAGTGYTSTTQAGSTVGLTHNTAGISAAWPLFLTTAAQSNHSHGNPTLNLTNLSGTTASASNGLTLSLSAAAQSVQPVAVSGSNGSFAFSTLSFGNLNGLSFYTSNGSLVGSYTDAGGGGGSDGYNSAQFTNSTANSTMPIVWAGNSGGSGNVTIGLTGSTVTMSAPSGGGGGGVTVNNWQPFDIVANTSFSSFGQNSLYLQNFVPEFYIECSNLEWWARGSFASSTNSQVYAQTIQYGMYSDNGGTMNLMASSSVQIRASFNSNTAVGYTISQGAGSFTSTSGATNVMSQISGPFHNYFPFTTTLNANNSYAVAVLISSATTVGTSPFRYAPLIQTVMNTTNFGRLWASTVSAPSATVIGDHEMGVFTTTTGALPATIANSNLTIAISRQILPFQFDL